jgi:hypothetical protein
MVWLKHKLLLLKFYASYPYHWIKDEIEYRKKLKKIRENDPYIYD